MTNEDPPESSAAALRLALHSSPPPAPAITIKGHALDPIPVTTAADATEPDLIGAAIDSLAAAPPRSNKLLAVHTMNLKPDPGSPDQFRFVIVLITEKGAASMELREGQEMGTEPPEPGCDSVMGQMFRMLAALDRLK